MTRACLIPPTGKAADAVQSLVAPIPRIETERLVLRAPSLNDWPFLEPIWTSDRAKHIGGPFSAKEGFEDFAMTVSSWLLRGFGSLTIEAKDDGAVLGLVLLGHEWWDLEPELGWLLTAKAEGKGIATEAATALRELGVELFGDGGFVSYVASENLKSIAVAERLCAVPDPAPHPVDETVLVYRHSGDPK